jgi:hypothetical protein
MTLWDPQTTFLLVHGEHDLFWLMFLYIHV